MTGFNIKNGKYFIDEPTAKVEYIFKMSSLGYRYLPLVTIIGVEEAAKIIDLELAMSGGDKELERLRNKAGIKLE